MKKIILFVVLLSTTIVFSQEKIFEKEVAKIAKKIEKITTEEKDSLRLKVKKINLKLEESKITIKVADSLKKVAAFYHAKKIEERVGVQEQELQKLVQEKAEGKIASFDDENEFTIGNAKVKVVFEDNKRRRSKKERVRKKKHSKRTTSQIVFAFGVNNVLIDNQLSSLNNSDYQFWKSRFYEIGYTFKTRFTKEANKFYFKYGLSFLWNNLRPENNQYQLVNGNITSLITYPETLSENRLRHVQMTFPMHLEFDFSKNKNYKDGRTRDRSNNSVRMGFGGFFGFNLGNRQFLEYKNAQGIKVEEIQKGNFNINRLIYGVSTYIGYKNTSLYVKYDMNPLFKDTEIRNISFGIRFDWN